MDELIYLDNAASTMKKPASVVAAITEALTSFGGPGRGGHPAAIASSMALLSAGLPCVNFLKDRPLSESH